jgi:hypothetical protein
MRQGRRLKRRCDSRTASAFFVSADAVIALSLAKLRYSPKMDVLANPLEPNSTSGTGSYAVPRGVPAHFHLSLSHHLPWHRNGIHLAVPTRRCGDALLLLLVVVGPSLRLPCWFALLTAGLHNHDYYSGACCVLTRELLYHTRRIRLAYADPPYTRYVVGIVSPNRMTMTRPPDLRSIPDRHYHRSVYLPVIFQNNESFLSTQCSRLPRRFPRESYLRRWLCVYF